MKLCVSGRRGGRSQRDDVMNPKQTDQSLESAMAGETMLQHGGDGDVPARRVAWPNVELPHGGRRSRYQRRGSRAGRGMRV